MVVFFISKARLDLCRKDLLFDVKTKNVKQLFSLHQLVSPIKKNWFSSFFFFCFPSKKGDFF